VPGVTVTIITLDEAEHIAAAIDSAAWADEIVVVDAGSADDTIAIARQKGVRVDTRPWTGYVDQKNYAAELASHDWIVSLDADERITPGLAQEIRDLLSRGPAHGAYRIPRVTFHLGRWVRTTDFYPDFQVRLYDRRRARWRGRLVHESVKADGRPGQLTHEIEHYSYRNLSEHVDRLNHYTSLAARELFESGRRAGVVDLVLHPPAAFLRNYVLRRGLLDGTAGLTLSAINAWSVFLKFAKLWELERAQRAGRSVPGSTPDRPPAETRSREPEAK
jgi:glycosyltransferase involved in cell wall biosynthesis